MAKKHDNFLADAISDRHSKPHFTYWDGFRFGLGFFLSGVVTLLVLGGLTWGIIASLNLH